MARRTSSAGGGGVNLFPFLSILACLIGILTIIIKLVSDIQATETTDRSAEELARAKQLQELQSEIRSGENQLEAVRQQLKEKNSIHAKVQQLDDRRVVLRKQLGKPDPNKARETNMALQRSVEAMLDQIAALKKERPALEQAQAKLLAELEARKLKPDSKPTPVVIRPGGTGVARNTRLFFIECSGSGVVILDGKGGKTPVSNAAIGTEPLLNKVFSNAKAEPASLVLFLIRTDGYSTYLKAAGLAEAKFTIRTGKLPVPTKGEIDLSTFFP
jgi:hypothetical protein